MCDQQQLPWKPAQLQRGVVCFSANGVPASPLQERLFIDGIELWRREDTAWYI